jgi:predicted transcriptional regulator
MKPLPRPDLYVVIRRLDILHRSERSLGRTQLQIAAGINYTQSTQYLDLLSRRDLVALHPDAEGALRVELTPKGFEALLFLARGRKEVVGPDFPFRGEGAGTLRSSHRVTRTGHALFPDAPPRPPPGLNPADRPVRRRKGSGDPLRENVEDVRVEVRDVDVVVRLVVDHPK